ncbi:MAG: hypothetical protein K2L95_01825 [Alphaproteobacteria bacterium]|nr:hypothetical protein [Alphaproteobacteria bacterium]
MKKILLFALISAGWVTYGHAAVRDGTTTTRGATQQRVATTTTKSDSVTGRATAARTATSTPTTRGGNSTTNTVTPRSTTSTATRATSARAATTVVAGQSRVPATTARTGAAISRGNYSPVTAVRGTSARAATDQTMAITETRTGTAYEQCKNAYFTCMDQFCKLKNDDYRRCSCSNRVFDLTDARETLQSAGDKLTVFTENLDVVGMTAAQAAAMRTASEGENALTSDTSASKALLQAIMNSIRGEDSTVGGKYSDLNSINLSFDTTNAFGLTDAGAAIAAYNGTNLYNAVYPQCREAVRADCNDASLQRAITAYLMAVEQDCNTVQTAIETRQKQVKAAVREGSAMLDLARVENRQKHNSDDVTTCLNNVEAAVLSEEVCGAGYHRCLDNGEFIDISTGAPIAGVVKFYELENLLVFTQGVDAADQKLAKIPNNRTFVQNFENRVKKFAQPALDKCVEQADFVWDEYLDKAMLDIYYAQKSKVAEIKQGCFDFVSACYVNGDTALTAAMKELTGDAGIVLQPDKVTLNAEVCRDYVQSCDNMFDNKIVEDYINNRNDTDTLTACRAVVKQCFDKFGGTGYENFYYPYSGLFQSGRAPDWFTLYDETNGNDARANCQDDGTNCEYVSQCAQQLAKIESCKKKETVEKAFGGLDYVSVVFNKNDGQWQVSNGSSAVNKYGIVDERSGLSFNERYLRSTGVATEVYYQIVDTLTTQCTNVQGRFVEAQFVKTNLYDSQNYCISKFSTKSGEPYAKLVGPYGISDGENMCPRDYALDVDTQSWGACLCWENGARRSKWGQSVKCVAALPVASKTEKDEQTQKDVTVYANDANCMTKEATGNKWSDWATVIPSMDSKTKKPISADSWCTQTLLSNGGDNNPSNQVCPISGTTPALTNLGQCILNGAEISDLPEGMDK